MKLTLIRKYKNESYTIGDLLIDGKFFCNTIEDKVRELPPFCPDTLRFNTCKCKEKVYSETAIPVGIYKVSMKISPKFKLVLPYLHDVPHFLGILIHSGNTAKDSAGCIIVGYNTKPGMVLKSTATSIRLNDILSKGKDITIEIL